MTRACTNGGIRIPGGLAVPQFVKGLALSKAFYREVVAQLLNEAFPDLLYSAARIGWGSDVLGFDTPMSTDHVWGPQVDLFLSEDDVPHYAEEIRAFLSRKLPHEFRGFATSFTSPDPEGNGTQSMDFSAVTGHINHRVSVQTIRSFLEAHLGTDPRQSLSPEDWLSFSEQGLLEVTAGQVFHDGLGELDRSRALLEYYPRDVWLYRLAAQWRRLGQEEPFVGRCGVVDDDLGSRITAARLTRDLMRLCFLMERRYAPYSKWLGTAFEQLGCHATLAPLLLEALRARTWQERERALGESLSHAAKMHNSLSITPIMSTETQQFFDRPFRVIFANRFAEALQAELSDSRLRSHPLVGGVDQFSDCTDVTSYPLVARRLKAMYP